MRLHKLILLIAAFAFSVFYSNISAQCAAGQIEFTLTIDPDSYYDECSWTITNSDGTIQYFSGEPNSQDPQTYKYCLADSVCYRFNIKDDFGDGINPGSYNLRINANAPFYSNPNGNFGSGESVLFNCPPGSGCTDPLILEFGVQYAPFGESWYAFFPDSTGVYELSTCFPENTCRTKIWAYDRCQGLLITNNVLGTIQYAENGCVGSDLAKIRLFLAKDKLYYLRIGNHSPLACAMDSIKFEFSYQGPVPGCMDPTACNYEPLATVPDTCYYVGDPNCTNGPDLVIDEPRLIERFHVQVETNTDFCDVYEGCTTGYGTRHRVRFSTKIANIGNQDYFIGEVPANINVIDTTGQFVYDLCHAHWHYRGYAEYLIADMDGNILPIGSKNGFCVLDLSCSVGQFKYTCENMGISSGCEDEYDENLPCQWIDITGLPAGQYKMIARVNWDGSPDKAGRYELDYSNNSAQVCFELSYDFQGLPEVEVLTDCTPVVDCAGVVNGASARDCTGECNGSVITGDINADGSRNNSDFSQYMNEILTPVQTTTPCNDLHKDGQLSLYDAALMQECLLHENEGTYWASSFACLFPTGNTNPYDKHFFRLTNLNKTNKTFVVEIANNSRAMYGVDMTIEGVKIASVQEIHPTFDSVAIAIQPDLGRIVAITTNEKGVPRSSTFRQLFRVTYSALTNDSICIKEVREVVNDLYELATPNLDQALCLVDSTFVGLDVALPIRPVHVSPNPTKEYSIFNFPSIEGEWAQFTLTNAFGQVVRTWSAYNNQTETVYRKDLPNGMYQLHIRSTDSQGVVRWILQ